MRCAAPSWRVFARDWLLRTAAWIGARTVVVASSVGPQLDATSPDEPVIVLITGIDMREPLRKKYRTIRQGYLKGARADLILLAGIGAKGQLLEVLSLPRDLAVRLPMIGHQRLGWAYDYGGARMLVDAVQGATGLPIHHLVQFDFQGFAAAIDAVGGVAMDLPAPMYDERAGLDLPSGRRTLSGVEALALVRSRSPAATGDDGVAPGGSARTSRLASVVEELVRRFGEGVKPIGLVSAVRSVGPRMVVDDVSVVSLFASMIRQPSPSLVKITNLPARTSVPTPELMSIFPPHYRSGSTYLELEQPQASEILDSFRERLRSR